MTIDFCFTIYKVGIPTVIFYFTKLRVTKVGYNKFWKQDDIVVNLKCQECPQLRQRHRKHLLNLFKCLDERWVFY